VAPDSATSLASLLLLWLRAAIRPEVDRLAIAIDPRMVVSSTSSTIARENPLSPGLTITNLTSSVLAGEP